MVKLEKGIESGSTRLLSFAVVMLMVFFSAGVLQGAIVEYTVVVTDMSSVELAKDGSGNYIVSPGQNFLAEVWVDDLRPVGTSGGVFAAYTDLVYDVDEIDFVSGTLVIDSFFNFSQSGTINDPGQEVDEAGGFDGFTASGADPAQLLFTVQGQVHGGATLANPITIQTNAAEDSPSHDTLVFGLDTPVTNIAYGSATIVPEPVSLCLLTLGGLAAVLRRRK